MMSSGKLLGADDQTAVSKKLELDEKLGRALREDSVDTTVVLAELKSLNDGVLDHSNTRLRIRLERFLESTPLEIFLVALVIIDVVILLAMLLMDLNILHFLLKDGRNAASLISTGLHENCEGNPELSHYNGSNLIRITRYLDHYGCLWGSHSNNGTNGSEVEVGSVHHRRKRSAAGPVEEGTNPAIAVLSEIGHIFHILSVAILAIMVFEVALKIFALGKKYFKGKLEVVDGIVILISFTLDLLFIDGVGAGGVNNGSTILVIFLLWRMLRVFNALLVTAKKRLQFRIRVQKRMRKVLEDKVEVLGDDIRHYEDHVENLTRLAKRHNVPDYEIKACKPLVKQLKRASTSAGLASMMNMSMGLMHGMNNMKSEEPPRKSVTGNKGRQPLIAEKDDEPASVSGVLIDAMNASGKVAHDISGNIQPVSSKKVVGSNKDFSSTSNLKSSVPNLCAENGYRIPSVEFAKAIGTGNSTSHSNTDEESGDLLNISSDKENNNPNSNHKINSYS